MMGNGSAFQNDILSNDFDPSMLYAPNFPKRDLERRKHPKKGCYQHPSVFALTPVGGNVS